MKFISAKISILDFVERLNRNRLVPMAIKICFFMFSTNFSHLFSLFSVKALNFTSCRTTKAFSQTNPFSRGNYFRRMADERIITAQIPKNVSKVESSRFVFIQSIARCTCDNIVVVIFFFSPWTEKFSLVSDNNNDKTRYGFFLFGC